MRTDCTGGDFVELLMLGTPYLLLLLVTGAKYRLVALGWRQWVELASGRLAGRLHWAGSRHIYWYHWWAREGKDWLLGGCFGYWGIKYMITLYPATLVWLSGLITVVLTLQIIAALILCFSLLEYRLPDWLQRLALRSSLPDTKPGNRGRALLWGLWLLIISAFSLVAWLTYGGLHLVAAGFLSCFLGFLSVMQFFWPTETTKHSLEVD